MDVKLFYSWQSDLPNSTNRGFIEQALKKAINAIKSDNSLQVEPVIDRDTSGVAGSPDIANTIFQKIDLAGAFVCDISIINSGSSTRLTPNPNVLIELGYAFKALGSNRIIMIANSAYGDVEELPFDLRARRVVTYNLPNGTSDKVSERKSLEAKLIAAIKEILQEIEIEVLNKTPPKISLTEETVAAIENGQANQATLLRQWIKWFTNEMYQIAPELSGKTDGDDLLVAALETSEKLVYEFSRVAEAIAVTGSEKSAETLSQIFGFFLEHYHPVRGFSGSFYESDFDFYKFLGHETFVTFYALLIREERWNLVASLLGKEIYVENSRNGLSDMEPFDELATYLWWLERRNEKLKLARLSVHADLLNMRHTDGLLAGIVSMREFIDADYFLYLRAEFVDPYNYKSNRVRWRAWSIVYMHNIPIYLVKSIEEKYALSLLPALGLTTIEEFKSKFAERGYAIETMFQSRSWTFGIQHFDASRIAIK